MGLSAKRRVFARAFAAAILASGASSCALLLGLEDRELGPDDAGGADGSGDTVIIGDSSDGADGEDGCTGDLDADPENCGRCGHSCAGNSCSSGVCENKALADSIVNPTAIAVFNGFVYWVESGDLLVDGGVPPGEVWQVATSGGTPARVFADDSGSPVDGVTAGPTTLFWTTESATGAIVHTPAGVYCRPPPSVSFASVLAASPDGLYVTEPSALGLTICFADGGLFQNPDVPRVRTLSTFGSQLLIGTSSGVAIIPSKLWYCPNGIVDDAAACVSDFGSVPTLAGPRAATLSPSNAYWASPAAGILYYRVTGADASLSTQANVDAQAGALVADDSHVFILSRPAGSPTDPGAVFSFVCGATGCSDQRTLLDDFPTAFAMDNLAIYVAVARPLADGGTSGAIIKIAKP